ncbi:tetratricopeptide repeat protein [Mucilaginibacter ximonensis]|uniref:Tetratricopeptide repeat protein n=1 Tax=Mucilaginibacter ximonensis TaxID=538021 RepID=A0ABW5Y9B3_9SPHI
MRFKFLLAGVLSVVISTASFAQQYRVKHAADAYDSYLKLNRNTATFAEADKSLIEARESLDIAAANSKTADLPQTLALKAAIYATLAVRDTNKKNNVPFFNKADSAYKKGKELDTQGANKAIFDDAAVNLGQFKLNEGVKDFQAHNYGVAYKNFNYYKELFPTDTTALFYTGLAAQQNNDIPNAMANYEKLLPMQYSKNAYVYISMSNFYLNKGDTVNSLKMATEGVAKFPSDVDLRKREIEISLATGKSGEILSKVQAAIAADPKNKQLYYYAGLTYSSSGSAVHDELDKAKKAKKDAATLAALAAKKDDFYAKAADMYKKAIEIDPNYFEATLNLGSVLLSPAIDMHNAAGELPASKQKEYVAMQAKAKAQFEVAKPYVLKAVELNPKSSAALTNLRNYYVGVEDMAKVTETTQKIKALGGQ